MSTPTSTPATSPDGQAPARSLDEIERDVTLARDRLAAAVDELAGRLQPQALSRQARHRAQSLVYDEHGRLRVGRVAAAAGAVAVITLIRLVRSRRH